LLWHEHVPAISPGMQLKYISVRKPRSGFRSPALPCKSSGRMPRNCRFIFPILFYCAKRFSKPPEQTDLDFKLPHDVVSTCAKRDEPPSRRSRLHSFAINILFHHRILSMLSARLRGFLFVLCFLWTEFSCFFVPFVVSSIANVLSTCRFSMKKLKITY